jgi:hypothetical protein
MIDFSIIIVNYNSGSFLRECIQSIINALEKISYEIIVVDNMSTDTSFSECNEFTDNHLILIQSGENLGFSKANNIGVKHASGRLLHFLNPDTRISKVLEDDYQDVLNDYLNNIRRVYVNPLQDKDGTVYYGSDLLPDTLNILKYYFCQSKAKLYYIGASIIIPQDTYNKIGGWNERIFMYGEDADLFFRIYKNKLGVIKLPSIIYHYGGGSSNKTFTNLSREVLIQKSLRIYFQSNHLSWFNYWLFQILVLLQFISRPKRLWWQIKAYYYSFVD